MFLQQLQHATHILLTYYEVHTTTSTHHLFHNIITQFTKIHPYDVPMYVSRLTQTDHTGARVSSSNGLPHVCLPAHHHAPR